MSKKPYIVYYLGREVEQPLPVMHNKFDVKFITNPNEDKRWRKNGRQNLLERHEIVEELRSSKQKKEELQHDEQ